MLSRFRVTTDGGSTVDVFNVNGWHATPEQAARCGLPMNWTNIHRLCMSLYSHDEGPPPPPPVSGVTQTRHHPALTAAPPALLRIVAGDFNCDLTAGGNPPVMQRDGYHTVAIDGNDDGDATANTCCFGPTFTARHQLPYRVDFVVWNGTALRCTAYEVVPDRDIVAHRDHPCDLASDHLPVFAELTKTKRGWGR